MASISTTIVCLLVLIIHMIYCTEDGNTRQTSHKLCDQRSVQDCCIDRTLHKVFPWQKYRLPKSLLPESYHIYLHPNITLQKYTGRVMIYFTVLETTDVVILHSKGHQIKRAYLTGFSNKTMKPSKEILHCRKFETVSFDFDHTLEIGKNYQILIDYYGDLTYSLEGFYLSKHKSFNGREVVIATTHFESTSARSAFPCFDEPLFKANFSLSMIRNPTMHTLFNMPMETTTTYQDIWQRDDFMCTVKMSTYLVAFVVSDFISIETTTKAGLKVSVFSSPDKIGDTRFALDFAVKALQYYERLFEIKFPLPKLDLIAIPDFPSGAMENWGLVTYRENDLLYNPSTSSIVDQEVVAKVIAHELAHQWFGNLVTMAWWNDLWLNEGFASFMESYAVDEMERSWNVMSEFVIKYVLTAMTTDSSSYTHPISVPVKTTSSIEEIFDGISYFKGASLIAMLVDLLGADSFFAAVKSYLKKFAYKNANTDDLIQVISEHATDEHHDIKVMMKTWTKLPGFPVVKVSLQDEQVVIKQSRFFFPQSKVTIDQPSKWQIPLSYVTDQMPTTAKRHFFSTTTDKLKMDTFEWIKFNRNFSGYYKVSYDLLLWSRLSAQMMIDHKIFTVNDRVSILSDVFTMARVGEMDYGSLFVFLRYIKKEKDYAPIVAARTGLGYVKHVFRMRLQDPDEERFNAYVVDLFNPLYEELGWKTRSSFDRQLSKLQSEVVHQSCWYGNSACIETALRMFKSWKENGADIPVEYTYVVFSTAVLYGTESESDWNHLWSVYLGTNDVQSKKKILGAICLTTDTNKIHFLLEEILKGIAIRSQDTPHVISVMANSAVGGSMAWQFVKEHWEDIVEIHGTSSMITRLIVESCLSTFLEGSDVTDAEDFFESKKLSDMKYIKQALESSRIRIFWFREHFPSVTQYLQQNMYMDDI